MDNGRAGRLTLMETICRGQMDMGLQSLVTSRWKELARRVPGNIGKPAAGKGVPAARPYGVRVGGWGTTGFIEGLPGWDPRIAVMIL